MNFLLDWWTTHPNYSKYKGKGNNGVRKIKICTRLCEEINKISRCARTPAGVKGKISAVEIAWRKAHNWASETGKGVKENEGIDSFEQGCLRYCRFYFILHNVMVDRSLSKAHILSEGLFGENGNEVSIYVR